METHVLAFPWPLQGHINSMLHLASALLDADHRVTLLHTEHNLRRLTLAGAPLHHPRLRVLSVPDDHPHSVGGTIALCRELRALILNTAVSMVGPALARIAPHMRNVFAVGPIHARPRPAAGEPRDDGCAAWLDGREDWSVVYVNLGSLTIVSSEQLAELFHGLVAAGYAFLCVLRPDIMTGAGSPFQEAVDVADDRALVVEWGVDRDVQDVLRHRAVGCFLTHAGWNSTLEAAVEGVPMVCWPFFADQMTVSHLHYRKTTVCQQ